MKIIWKKIQHLAQAQQKPAVQKIEADCEPCGGAPCGGGGGGGGGGGFMGFGGGMRGGMGGGMGGGRG